MANSRLKIAINCLDCGEERIITKACLNMVTRCKPCQKKFNKEKARNRYRKIKGIPLDKPVTQIIKKKNEEKEERAPEPKKKAVKPQKIMGLADTPKEVERRRKVIEKLLAMFPDQSTADDW